MKENGESMNFISLFLKGFLMGLFMLVPGVSGGTIAIILKIYDELLMRLSNIFLNFKRNFVFLLTVLVGGIIGIFISSYFLRFIFVEYYFEMIFVFVGILIYYLLETTFKSGRKYIFKNSILIIIGMCLGYLLTIVPVSFLEFKNKYLTLFILGVFLASALILPGISVSYILLIFNIYDKVLLAIQTFDIFYLLELGVALLIGIVVVVKGLSYLLIKKKYIAENIINGFIITSIFVVLPPINSTKDVVYLIILILIGIIFEVVINTKKN